MCRSRAAKNYEETASLVLCIIVSLALVVLSVHYSGCLVSEPGECGIYVSKVRWKMLYTFKSGQSKAWLKVPYVDSFVDVNVGCFSCHFITEYVVASIESLVFAEVLLAHV